LPAEEITGLAKEGVILVKAIWIYFICVVFFVAAMSGCQSQYEPSVQIQPGAQNEELISIPPAETASDVPQQPASPDLAGVQVPGSVTETKEPLKYQPQSTDSRDIQIQKALANAGFYKGNIDGKIGPMSKQAIMDFQKANSLKVDGVVGPQTWGELEKHLQ